MNQYQEFKFPMRTQVLTEARRDKRRHRTYPDAVDRCLEQLCKQGCARVSGYIDDLRSGKPVPGTEALDRVQQQKLLGELESIMSVYQCSCDGR